MLIKEAQVPFLSRKIAYDLLNSGFVTFPKGIDNAISEIEDIIMDDVLWEREIEDKAREILAKQEEENEFLFYDVDRREVFKLIKKEIANEEGFNLKRDERIDDLSHFLVKELWDKEFIDYDVRDGKIKNIIFNSIMEFLNREREARDEVYRKLENYKRPLIPGTEEWELVFNRLYEQELKKRGLI
ncbi:conserved hypothetical protein [Lebetimonas natsushimae]|uniref:Uncharacterized protein n=1 Tax=Lebetimonas natsushimae TaxID=1936991 RepID=A0A292YHB3_9BACT|nr:DUF507 family protein [Lebetimonas natsushimae]GAX88311.1 conserved hypothetical protein [Lebetimonas natsushimae]